MPLNQNKKEKSYTGGNDTFVLEENINNYISKWTAMLIHTFTKYSTDGKHN